MKADWLVIVHTSIHETGDRAFPREGLNNAKT
jgi:hypothetical protein